MRAKIDKLQEFLDREFPLNEFVVDSIGKAESSIIKEISLNDRRPGNSVSGPTLMAIADTATYIAIIAETKKIEAVTNHLSINFLNKPSLEKNIIAKCKLIKLGSSIAVGNVEIYSQEIDLLIAVATVSYSFIK